MIRDRGPSWGARCSSPDAAGKGFRELRTSCLGWPEIPQCAFYVAEQYAREGNPAQARRSAAFALARDPGYAPAARLLRSVDAPEAIGQTPGP